MVWDVITLSLESETFNPLSLHPDIPFCAQSIQSTNVRLIFQTHSSCFATPYSLTNQASLLDYSSAPKPAFEIPLNLTLFREIILLPQTSFRSPTHPSPVIFRLIFLLLLMLSTLRKHLPSFPLTIRYHLCLGSSPVPSFSEAFSNIVPFQSPLFFSTHSFYSIPLTLKYMRQSLVNEIHRESQIRNPEVILEPSATLPHHILINFPSNVSFLSHSFLSFFLSFLKQ